MPIMSKPSMGTGISIGFITGGTLTAVWSGIWYYYLLNHVPDESGWYYVCTGLFLSGLVFVLIGVTIGHIGRAARRAEIPPPEVTQAVANVDQNAAARAPVIVPVNPAQAAVTPAQNVATPVPTAPPVATPAPTSNVYVPPRGAPSVK